jgi:hypothetical protein
VPVSAASLKYYLSGGAANADPNASLGGARSSVQVAAGIDNLFADATAAEAAAGSVKYRCIYFRNEDANANGLMAPLAAWLAAVPAVTGFAIGIGTAKGDAATVVDENTSPVVGTLVGAAFSAPTTKATGIACPAPLLQNEYVAVWVRRTILAGAASNPNDGATIDLEGDTA